MPVRARRSYIPMAEGEDRPLWKLVPAGNMDELFEGEEVLLFARLPAVHPASLPAQRAFLSAHAQKPQPGVSCAC